MITSPNRNVDALKTVIPSDTIKIYIADHKSVDDVGKIKFYALYYGIFCFSTLNVESHIKTESC